MSKATLARGWRTHIPLTDAKKMAKSITEKLEPWCRPGHIIVAGSIRREKLTVNDVDIVCIPENHWRLLETIRGIGNSGGVGLKKIEKVIVGGVSIDIYIATPQNWTALLLIRTGSAENNIRLCSIAKKKGWHLAADGSGLFSEKGERIAGDTEERLSQKAASRVFASSIFIRYN
jgi:DNA polymerase/3'-5' exonuclease PolX